ncbi:hypothetical protein BDP27DRAFT_1374302 [Rhodocollybia butyracea]|uniref:Uncharacterized protein n=1 Tax=Rhodocollybia butyracea TaxID=206335 RepID=A0A9P5TXJ0_9AGAR|nr:hypothetical protein BDP27DRAFT_1374302 [Rhodocollybia butyracea]
MGTVYGDDQRKSLPYLGAAGNSPVSSPVAPARVGADSIVFAKSADEGRIELLVRGEVEFTRLDTREGGRGLKLRPVCIGERGEDSNYELLDQREVEFTEGGRGLDLGGVWMVELNARDGGKEVESRKGLRMGVFSSEGGSILEKGKRGCKKKPSLMTQQFLMFVKGGEANASMTPRLCSNWGSPTSVLFQSLVQSLAVPDQPRTQRRNAGMCLVSDSKILLSV